jgi:uncharacterized protein (TIGR02646 family)
MKFISKQPHLPRKFNNWLVVNQATLHSRTFESLPQEVKNSLQDALILEQGHICCFCGSRIYRENTEIAHFIPQKEEVAEKVWQTNQEVVFDYNNLFASCNGGTNDVTYQVRPAQLASGIIADFDVIEIFDYDLRNKISPTTRVREGLKVIVNQKLDKQQIHCNNAQKSQRLHFSFFSPQLENYFYFKISGEIDSNYAELQQDIKTLNLNSAYLCGQRKRIVNLIEKMYEEGFFDDEQARLNFLEDYCNLKNTKFRPFVFVYATELKRFFNV